SRQPSTTERLTYNNAVPAEPDRHNCTVSIENVENVVNELSKLVPSIRRHLVHIFPRLESAVNSQPSNTHPAILTANVPYGNPSSLLRWQPCHRSQTTAAITHKTCIAFPLRYINCLSYVSDTVSYSTLHIRKIRALRSEERRVGKEWKPRWQPRPAQTRP